tara:strand:+ start:1614 stop:1949 length:336 start_codon:yes stop_codon:yes gene_type:complete
MGDTLFPLFPFCVVLKTKGKIAAQVAEAGRQQSAESHAVCFVSHVNEEESVIVVFGKARMSLQEMQEVAIENVISGFAPETKRLDYEPMMTTTLGNPGAQGTLSRLLEILR